MKVIYSETAKRDLVQQFRFYLVDQESPDTAISFRKAVRTTSRLLSEFPLIGSRYPSRMRQLEGLRSWPVSGFENVRIFYLARPEVIEVVRILHGKRNLSRLLRSALSKRPS